MHLADAFIQSDLFNVNILLVHAFPENQTYDTTFSDTEMINYANDVHFYWQIAGLWF